MTRKTQSWLLCVAWVFAYGLLAGHAICLFEGPERIFFSIVTVSLAIAFALMSSYVFLQSGESSS